MVVIKNVLFFDFLENDARLRAQHRRDNSRDMLERRSTMLAICNLCINLLLHSECFLRLVRIW